MAPNRDGRFNWASLRRNLNFFRIHLVGFIVIPFVASGIFYASNGPNYVSYLDSLFMCLSYMTMTGLNTVLMADLTRWQQVILFLLVIMGSSSTVSIIMVYVRLHYFRKRFKEMPPSAKAHTDEEVAPPPWRERLDRRLHARHRARGPLSASMIHRVDEPRGDLPVAPVDEAPDRPESIMDRSDGEDASNEKLGEALADDHAATAPVDRTDQPVSPRLAFDDVVRTDRAVHQPLSDSRVPMQRTATRRSAKETGYGGFANPVAWIMRYLHFRGPKLIRQGPSVERVLSQQVREEPTRLQRSATVYSTNGDARAVTYISFDVLLGRNSAFRHLTHDQEEELGGVEYRALSLLLWITIAYCLLLPLLSIVILAPYFARAQFNSIFDRPGGTDSTWFTFFQVFSAFENLGSSLFDESLTIFQDTYLLLIILIFLIVSGNTGLPIFLRLTIWTLSKVVPRRSRVYESLEFLLDHPRRCYLYLFPSYQTWYLAFVLLMLNGIDWASFLILDIGNGAIDSIPLNVRFIDGLMQAVATRTGGFSVVFLSTVAPALQVLYVIMMYISAYPIAMTVRGTNVYEARSIGIFNEDKDESEVEAEDTRHAMAYIGYHARKQLSFDLWWLAVALWIICIAERGSLMDPDRASWFNVFTIIFELVSGYGTVGISLGWPFSNISFCGAWTTISKLVLMAVMLRGRHRGLPNAIDRAIMLPSDMAKLRAVPAANSAEALKSRAALHRIMSGHRSTALAGEEGQGEARSTTVRSAATAVRRHATMPAPSPHTGVDAIRDPASIRFASSIVKP